MRQALALPRDPLQVFRVLYQPASKPEKPTELVVWRRYCSFPNEINHFPVLVRSPGMSFVLLTLAAPTSHTDMRGNGQGSRTGRHFSWKTALERL